MKKRIGIIGGADPAASCLLYKKIIDACLERSDCKNGGDFPEIVIINYPFVRAMQVVDAQAQAAHLVKQLQYSVDKLVTAGVDILALACNTLHTFMQGVELYDKEFVPLPALAAQHLVQRKICSALLLATETTIETRLYASSESCSFYTPDRVSQAIIDNSIETVHSNSFSAADSEKIGTIVKILYAKKPFDAVVLGCTDLPVLHEAYPIPLGDLPAQIGIINPTVLLAQELVNKSFR